MSKYTDELTDHDYDGIQEFDNPMPAWWVNIFIITVIWSGFYVAGLGMGWINGVQDDLKEGQDAIVKARLAHAAAQPNVTVDAAYLDGKMKDKDMLAKGKAVFKANCASCHAEDGGGGVGANLVDDHWIHGAESMEVYNTITKGVIAKGMPPWESNLQDSERAALVVFIASLRGTKPAKPKKAEGKKVTGGIGAKK